LVLRRTVFIDGMACNRTNDGPNRTAKSEPGRAAKNFTPNAHIDICTKFRQVFSY
jgi:hypothetical protein